MSTSTPSIPTAATVSAPQLNLHELLGDVGLDPEDLRGWLEDLREALQKIRENPAQDAGFTEESIRQHCRELERRLLADALQRQGDRVAAMCPKCGDVPLTGRWRQKSRPLRTIWGPMCVTRTGGYCKKCDASCYPADARLGLSGGFTASPLLREVSALLVSKMPAEPAEEISQRVCGIRLNHAGLAWDARRQWDRAIEMLPGLQARAAWTTQKPLQGEVEPKPFTLVLQVDAWNIRERDHWNETEAMRASDPTFSRWHWVYVATAFRLDQRCVTGQPGDEASLTLGTFWRNGYRKKLFPHAELTSVSRN